MMLHTGFASAQTLLQPTNPIPPATDAPPKIARPPAKLIYLSADSLPAPRLLLPSPPKPDSLEGRGDLAAVKAVQAGTTSERIALAARDDANENVWLYADVLPGFVADKLPLTDALFKGAENDIDIEVDGYKPFFGRTRPFDLDHSIKTCVPSTYGLAPRSYPSGHATIGYSLGVILANLIPEKADIILARAKIFGDSRVVCGVHFPSDIVASQALGTAVALEIMRNPAFKQAFAEARAELVAAGVTN